MDLKLVFQRLLKIKFSFCLVLQVQLKQVEINCLICRYVMTIELKMFRNEMSHVKQISFSIWTTPICNEQLFIDKWNARYWGNGVYGTQSTPKFHLCPV